MATMAQVGSLIADRFDICFKEGCDDGVVLETVTELLGEYADMIEAREGKFEGQVMQYERELVTAVLDRCGQNLSKTAAYLGISDTKLRTLIKKLDIEVQIRRGRPKGVKSKPASKEPKEAETADAMSVSGV